MHVILSAGSWQSSPPSLTVPNRFLGRDRTPVWNRGEHPGLNRQTCLKHKDTHLNTQTDTKSLHTHCMSSFCLQSCHRHTEADFSICTDTQTLHTLTCTFLFSLQTCHRHRLRLSSPCKLYTHYCLYSIKAVAIRPLCCSLKIILFFHSSARGSSALWWVRSLSPRDGR